MADTRLQLTMTGQEIVLAMAGGNPGGLRVCAELLQNGAKVDPDAFTGAALLELDSLGIYEGRIWAFFRYVCNQDLAKMIAVLRAYQLGQLAGVTAEALNRAIDNYGEGIDADAAVEAVKNRLPNFQPEALTT